MVVEAVLGGALGAAVVAIAVLTVMLTRTRRDLKAARARLHAPRALQTAERAVRSVVDAAAQVRRQGVAEFLMTSIQDLTRWTSEDRASIANTAAPDGTVTIFFSDIKDSTQINERLGDARWLDVLSAHDRLVRTNVQRRGGHVVKTQGDGFMVVFGSATDGVRAAVAIQAELARARGSLRRNPIKVRIGLHVGKVTSRDGDYFGRNVAVAARVAAYAMGGQILVTEEVRGALGDDLDPADATLTVGDEVELRGLSGRHQLWIVLPTRPH